MFINSPVFQTTNQQRTAKPVSAGNYWEHLNDGDFLKTYGSTKYSPFYHNEMRISKLVKRFIHLQQDGKALELMRKVIDAEKSWRFQRCSKLFGKATCKKRKINPEPFFIWRHQVMHTLLDDPTHEIIERVRYNINNFKHY